MYLVLHNIIFYRKIYITHSTSYTHMPDPHKTINWANIE